MAASTPPPVGAVRAAPVGAALLPPAAARAGAVLLSALVLTMAAAGPARAHTDGVPAYAQVTATAGRQAAVVWTAGHAEVTALARDLGVDVPPGHLLSPEQDAVLSASDALADAVAERVRMQVRGRACRSSVEVTSLVASGIRVRFTCPMPVSEARLRITLLSEVDARYRTLAVAGTAQGLRRVLFTRAAPEHRLALDSAAARLVGAPSPTQSFRARAPGRGVATPLAGDLLRLVDRPVGLASALLTAVLVGAAHALAPGHGKAAAGAYVLASRGRLREAALAGGAVGAVHTWSALIVGVALGLATQRPDVAGLEGALRLVAGAALVVAGVALLVRRGAEAVGRRWGRGARAWDIEEGAEAPVGAAGAEAGARAGTDVEDAAAGAGTGIEDAERARDADGIEDAADDGDPAGNRVAEDAPRPVLVSAPGLLAVGAAGGLLPSPAPLLVVITAQSTGRLPFGLALVTAFGVGMAVTVGAVGAAAVQGREFLTGTRWRGAAVVVRVVPVLAAVLLAGLGALLLWRAGAGVLWG